MEGLITFEKLDVLVHELLVIELWNEKVFPLIKERVDERNSMRV